MTTDPGQVLKEARIRSKLTQHDLALLAKTTQSAISRIESGGEGATIKRLDKLLSLCGEELVLGSRPKRRSQGRGSNLLYLPR